MTGLNPDLVAAFWAFVQERQAIWHRRFVLQQPRPWTEDPVLQKEHITNVYRWLDPGTQYALSALQAAPTRQDAVYFTVAYRLLNRRAVLERFGQPPYRASHVAWLEFLEQERAARRSIFTRRHLTPHWKQYQEATSLALALEVHGTSREVFDQLTSLPGVGAFIGWQCYADLTYYLPETVLRRQETFVVPGDGACFALSVLLGERAVDTYHHARHDTSTRVRPTGRALDRFAKLVVQLQRSQPRLEHAPPQRPTLDVADVEHALCEWLRYLRAQHALKEKTCAS